MSGLVNRVVAGVATLAAAASLVAVGATPAAAATVTVDYHCAYLHIVVPQTFDITVTAPATATRGVPVTVTATVVSRHPLSQDTAAGAYQGVHRLVLEGAETGELEITPMSNPPLAAGQPWQITGSARITFDTAGTVTYKPGYTGFSRPGLMGCQPKTPATVPAAASTRVS